MLEIAGVGRPNRLPAGCHDASLFRAARDHRRCRPSRQRRGSRANAYITNGGDNTVSVIATATDTVTGSPIPVGSFPIGVAVTPDGSKVYVANNGDNTVSVIATATDTVTRSPIPVGGSPAAFGKFIQPAPAPTFAG
ncbi:MAG TPA: hypothetical protein VEK82_12085, partial [Stellaceae bacterium]|nr:hypothetical protein [Stellaceae bacterium]